jgi:hypothetical protein
MRIIISDRKNFLVNLDHNGDHHQKRTRKFGLRYLEYLKMTCPEISPDVKNYLSISVEKIVLKNPKLTVNLLNNQKDYSVEYLL